MQQRLTGGTRNDASTPCCCAEYTPNGAVVLKSSASRFCPLLACSAALLLTVEAPDADSFLQGRTDNANRAAPIPTSPACFGVLDAHEPCSHALCQGRKR